MKFTFDEPKAAQAAGHLLRRHGDAMSMLLLMKLLYLSERDSLLKNGRPLTGADLYSLPFGPVPSQVYDLAKGAKVKSASWQKMIQREGTGNDTRVVLLSDPGADRLSQFDIQVLDGIDEQFGNREPWALSFLTHDVNVCPEWKDPHGSSAPIRPEDIFRLWGVSKEEIDVLAREADSHWEFDQALARAAG